jgi:hypothetical protein
MTIISSTAAVQQQYSSSAPPGRQLCMDIWILSQVQAEGHDPAIIEERLHLPPVLQQQAEQLQRLGQPAQHQRQLGLGGSIGRRLLGQPVAVAAAEQESG